MFEFIGWVVVILLVAVYLILGITMTHGGILLLIPVAGIAWVAYRGFYLWHSPNFWLTIIWVSAVAAVIGVIVFLSRLHD